MTTTTQPQALGGVPAGTGHHEITGTYKQAITGRYRRITTHQLAIAWWLFITNKISYRQLRIYFAAHEMAERRRYTGSDKTRVKPHYDLPELKALVGGRGSKSADRDLSSDVKRLGELGLVLIKEREVHFAASIEQIAINESLDDFWNFYREIPNRRRTVPVPRRTLRALAAGFRRGETAYVLAALIRSVFWHKETGTYRTDGRTKGSWVAEVFRISRRAVTDARTRLIELGWLRPLDPPQWALNKWGVHDIVNVDWTPKEVLCEAHGEVKEGEGAPVGEGRAEGGFASPSGQLSGESASPCLNRPTLPTGDKKTRKLEAKASGSPWSGSRKKEKGAKGKPKLSDVRAEDLKEAGSLLELYRQAIASGLASKGEAGRLDFFAMAHRARTRGQRPGALFVWLLRERKTEFITIADEDAARRQLREHDYGPDMRAHERGGGGEQSPPAELSAEERLVEACLLVAKQNRIEDPAAIAREARGWSRDKWERELLAYRTNQSLRQVSSSAIGGGASAQRARNGE